MVYNRKRKHCSIKLNSTIEKVLKNYGQDVTVGQVETKNRSGRKQRRREKKQLVKANKQAHFRFLSKRRSGDIKRDKPQELPSDSKSKSNVDDGHLQKQSVSPTKSKKAKIDTGNRKEQKTVFKNENAKEDKVITALEKKLFLDKRKNKKKLPKSFVDAGLDYILNAVSGENLSEDSSSDIEDNFISDGADSSGEPADDFLSDCKKDNNNDDDCDEPLNFDDFKECNLKKIDEDENIIEENTNEVKRPELIPDQITGKYKPPAMRASLSNDLEENTRKLHRKVKGLFNRLSDANINNVCTSIEILYRENSRAMMHSVIARIIINQFASPDPVPESLKIETAMLVSVLSARIGIEVLMHFYEVASVKLHTFLISKDELNGKAANNLLQLLGCLYQLRSIDCKVILDITRILVDSFMEKDVELMLDILNKIGFQLRKDEPESLRDIIKQITSKCEALNVSVDDGSRMAYMLTVLMAVKNNNVRKVTGFDPDAIAVRRKKLAALTKNTNSDKGTDTVPPVKLQDFLDADNNGRWWIVGSSFSGRPMLEQEKKQSENCVDIDFSVSKKVTDAAKMQRMNTDVRRKIFYAVMMADDFVDAFHKIMKCGLKGKQLREIPNVIVDCCQQEKSFNPYYIHLLNRFCKSDRQFAISLQCTLWDRFKVLDSFKQSQITNVANLLSELILINALTLSCLKAIDFTEMDKTMVRFLRLVLCMLAENASSTDHLQTIFEDIRTSTKTKLVRQGLNLFLQYFMLSDETFMAKHSPLRSQFQIMLSSVGKTSHTLL